MTTVKTCGIVNVPLDSSTVSGIEESFTDSDLSITKQEKKKRRLLAAVSSKNLFFRNSLSHRKIYAHQTLEKLSQPTVLSTNLKVISTLVTHAQKHHCPLNARQIETSVARGERLLQALAQATLPIEKPGEINVEIDSQLYPIKSNLQTTIDITWAIYAMLAEKELEQGNQATAKTSPLLDQGTIVMKDPERKIGNFLRAAPTCYGRISSHYNEWARDNQKKILGHAVQRGIESYDKCFPGKGGSLLFSNIKPTPGAHDKTEELFLKIERRGMPIKLFSTSEKIERKKKHLINFFKAMACCFLHTISFIKTRRSQKATTAIISRKEHVHKDDLKETIWQPFEDLVRASGQNRKQQQIALKEAKKYGLEKIEAWLNAHADVDHIAASTLRHTIKNLRHNFDGTQTPAIGRRGAEVHFYLPFK